MNMRFFWSITALRLARGRVRPSGTANTTASGTGTPRASCTRPSMVAAARGRERTRERKETTGTRIGRETLQRLSHFHGELNAECRMQNVEWRGLLHSSFCILHSAFGAIIGLMPGRAAAAGMLMLVLALP